MNGLDNLYNSASATPQGVGTGSTWKQWQPTAAEQAAQTVKDDTSIAAYGLSSITFDNLQTIAGLATGNNSQLETQGVRELLRDELQGPGTEAVEAGVQVPQPRPTRGRARCGTTSANARSPTC